MDYLTQYALDELHVSLERSRNTLTLSEINVLNDGFNRLNHWQLKGTHTGNASDVFAWQGDNAMLQLARNTGQYCLKGYVSECMIERTHNGTCHYTLTIASNLTKLTQCCHYDYFSQLTLKELFKLLLNRHGILFTRFDFDDKTHPFELQYQQSDFDVFTSLTVQYGLVYFFEIIKNVEWLVITSAMPTFKALTLSESEEHNMLHDNVCAFDIKKQQIALANSVLLRSEDATLSDYPFESKSSTSRVGQSAQQVIESSMSRHEMHELYASYTSEELDEQAKQCQKQLDWQREIITFSTPLIALTAGDIITLKQTTDPRLAGQYRIISINTHTRKWLESGGEKGSSQLNITALPIEVAFSPLHPSMSSDFLSREMQPVYKRATPPLMLGSIAGNENLPEDDNGCYYATLSISKHKSTPPLRLMRSYTGVSKRGTYGVDFPLNGKTDVVIAMQNNCPQRLVILGSYANYRQSNVVNHTNAKQHIIQSKKGLGLCLDNETNQISLYGAEHAHSLIINGMPKSEQISLTNKTGEIKICADKTLKQSTNQTFTLSANELIKNVGKKHTSSSKNYYLNAKKSIVYHVSHSSIKTPFFELIGDHLEMTSSKLSAIIAGNQLNITTKKLRVSANDSIHIHAEKELNLNVGSTRINFTKDGSFNSNKKIEVHANTIDKHQVSLLSCGGNASFNTNEEIDDMISDLHNDEEFTARRKAKLKGYNSNFHEVTFVRINTLSIPTSNLASHMAKHLYANFISEKIEPIVEEAKDLTKKSAMASAAVLGGAELKGIYEGLSLSSRLLIGKSTLGGMQGVFGSWATGSDYIDTFFGGVFGAALGTLNINKFTPFEISKVKEAVLLSGSSNFGGQMVSKYRDPRKNKFNVTALSFAMWGGGMSGYLTQEISITLSKAIVDTIIQVPIGGIGSHVGVSNESLA